MKKLFAVMALVGSSFLLSSYSADEAKVYICTGGSSVCYHKTAQCRGLGSCSGEVKAITLAEAQKMNRRPCKMCFK